MVTFWSRPKVTKRKRKPAKKFLNNPAYNLIKWTGLALILLQWGCVTPVFESNQRVIEKSQIQRPTWIQSADKGLINYNGLSYVYKSSYLSDLNLGIMQFGAKKNMRTRVLLNQYLHKTFLKLLDGKSPISRQDDKVLRKILKNQLSRPIEVEIVDYYYEKIVYEEEPANPKTFLYALVTIKKSKILDLMVAVGNELKDSNSLPLKSLSEKLALFSDVSSLDPLL